MLCVFAVIAVDHARKAMGLHDCIGTAPQGVASPTDTAMLKALTNDR